MIRPLEALPAPKLRLAQGFAVGIYAGVLIAGGALAAIALVVGLLFKAR